MRLREVVAIGAATVLVAIAGLHLVWLVSVWPFASPTALVRTLIGTDNVASAPTLAPTIVVALLLTATAWMTLARLDYLRWPLPRGWLRWTLGLAAALLTLRGLGGFVVSGAFASEVTPEFAHWNAWIYSPLTLALGVALLVTNRSARV